MQTSDQINELGAALAKAQGAIRDAAKDSQGYNYSYANYDDYHKSDKVLGNLGFKPSNIIAKHTPYSLSITSSFIVSGVKSRISP